MGNLERIAHAGATQCAFEYTYHSQCIDPTSGSSSAGCYQPWVAGFCAYIYFFTNRIFAVSRFVYTEVC